eukprot:SAG31_NODE_3037_length_4761_cov_2.884384_7_plen_295_part_00
MQRPRPTAAAPVAATPRRVLRVLAGPVLRRQRDADEGTVRSQLRRPEAAAAAALTAGSGKKGEGVEGRARSSLVIHSSILGVVSRVSKTVRLCCFPVPIQRWTQQENNTIGFVNLAALKAPVAAGSGQLRVLAGPVLCRQGNADQSAVRRQLRTRAAAARWRLLYAPPFRATAPTPLFSDDQPSTLRFAWSGALTVRCCAGDNYEVAGMQVRSYFLVLRPLLEKYGTFIARCNALIEKVSPCIGPLCHRWPLQVRLRHGGDLAARWRRNCERCYYLVFVGLFSRLHGTYREIRD